MIEEKLHVSTPMVAMRKEFPINTLGLSPSCTCLREAELHLTW